MGSGIPPTAKPDAIAALAEKAPTSAADWRREVPEVEELPSGNRAVLTRPQILRMVKTGQIPNPLASQALALAEGSAVALDSEEVTASVELMELLVAACFVEPEVFVGDRDDMPPGALHVDDLDDVDKAHVLGWALRRALEFTTFRDERPGAEPGGDVGDVRDEAELDARPD